MRDRRQRHGFTLLETMIVVATVGAFLVITVLSMRNQFGENEAKGAARRAGDMMNIARQEAMRTGTAHLVFFGADAEDNALSSRSSEPAAVLVIRDDDGDGRVDAGEKVAWVLMQDTQRISWGSNFAANESTPVSAPNDNTAATFPPADSDFICCTFLDDGGNEARWIAFLPDGIPRAFSIGPFATGAIASGNGAVYVTSGTRDYAAVLSPLGGVRVHAYANGAGWTQ